MIVVSSCISLNFFFLVLGYLRPEAGQLDTAKSSLLQQTLHVLVLALDPPVSLVRGNLEAVEQLILVIELGVETLSQAFEAGQGLRHHTCTNKW